MLSFWLRILNLLFLGCDSDFHLKQLSSSLVLIRFIRISLNSSRVAQLSYFRNFQGCITVYLSRYCLLLLTAATLLSYHRCFSLSTTFFIFFDIFNFMSAARVLSLSSEYEYITTFLKCQHLFSFFIDIFLEICYIFN